MTVKNKKDPDVRRACVMEWAALQNRAVPSTSSVHRKTKRLSLQDLKTELLCELRLVTSQVPFQTSEAMIKMEM